MIVNITAKNNASMLTDSGMTGTSGLTRLNLTEFADNITGKFFFSNYTLNASYETEQNSSSVNMSANTVVRIVFAIPPLFATTPTFVFAGVDPVLAAGENNVRDNVTKITLYRYTPLSNVFVGARGPGRGQAEIAVYYENINITFGELCMRGKTGPFTTVRMRKTGVSPNGIPVVAIDLCGA